MTPRIRMLVLLVAVGLLPAAARADTINLTNGNRLKGRVVARTPDSAVILLDNGGRLTIPASQIDSIEPEAAAEAPAPPPPPPPPPAPPEKEPEAAKPAPAPAAPEAPAAAEKPPVGGEKPKTEGEKPPPEGEKPPPEGAKPPAPAEPPKTEKPAEPGAAEPPPEDAEAKKKAAEEAARVPRLMDLLGAPGEANAANRAAARAALVGLGEPALEALCAALQSRSADLRLGAATALGEIGSRKTVKPLLAAIYAGTPRTGNVEPWAIQFLGVCAGSLERISGRSFGYNGMYAGVARNSADRMLEWWGGAWKQYPLQVGDVPPDPKKPAAEPPDPVAEIKKLPFRSFPQPPPESPARKH